MEVMSIWICFEGREGFIDATQRIVKGTRRIAAGVQEIPVRAFIHRYGDDLLVLGVHNL